jgi:hypothetical protein
MFSIYINNKPLKCTEGTVYTYATVKEAVKMINICYGIASFKTFCKIKRNPLTKL